jgi:hypothetical protein
VGVRAGDEEIYNRKKVSGLAVGAPQGAEKRVQCGAQVQGTGSRAQGVGHRVRALVECTQGEGHRV